MNILIITDSIGYPRYWENQCVQDIYSFFPDPNEIKIYSIHFLSGGFIQYYSTGNLSIFQISRQGLLLNDIIEMINTNLRFIYQFNVIVLQFGIVECAPRIIKQQTKQWFERHTLISKPIHFILRRYRTHLIKMFSFFRRNVHTYTSQGDFKKKYKYLLKLIENKYLIILSIPQINPILNKKYPYWEEKIFKYNEILQECEENHKHTYIPMDDVTMQADAYMADGYHLSNIGHEIIKKKLLNKIKAISSNLSNR